MITERPRIDFMTDADLDRVMKLQSLPELGTGTESPQQYSRSTLEKAIRENKDSLKLVAVNEEGEVIGFLLASILWDLNDAYLHSIAVDQRYQGKGVAKALVEKATSELREKTGVNHPFAVVKTSNAASQKLLESEGFSRCDETYYYYDTGI